MDGEVDRGYISLFMLALASVPEHERDVICILAAEPDGITPTG